MASTGSVISRQSLIDDFIAAVMTPAANSSRYYAGSVPTTAQRAWDGGAIVGWSARSVINESVLSSPSEGLANPTTANLPTNPITATEIVNVFRSYAYNTTRIRNVLYGMYYTVYGNGSYTQTGVPSDNPVAHASGAITGTLSDGAGLAHLTTAYLVTIPAVANTPAGTDLISAPNLNSFYSNLRTAANPATNGSASVDLRICHSSCHNNCHGSRGRR